MYGKIFDSIYTGTLYGHWEAIVTFQQLIVLADADGIVDMTPQAICAHTSIPIEIIEKGLKKLGESDTFTRTPGEDGKRIVCIDEHRPWGWQIVNYLKYKHLRDSGEVREQNRIRAQRFRDKRNSASRDVTPSNTKSRYTDTDTDTDTKDKPKVAPLALPAWLEAEQWQAYVNSRPAKARTPESLKAAVRKLERFRAAGFDANEIVANSLANGWRGLFPPDRKNGVPQAASIGARPSITCSVCRQLAYTWTGDKCDPCWRKSQGLAA